MRLGDKSPLSQWEVNLHKHWLNLSNLQLIHSGHQSFQTFIFITIVTSSGIIYLRQKLAGQILLVVCVGKTQIHAMKNRVLRGASSSQSAEKLNPTYVFAMQVNCTVWTPQSIQKIQNVAGGTNSKIQDVSYIVSTHLRRNPADKFVKFQETEQCGHYQLSLIAFKFFILVTVKFRVRDNNLFKKH